MKKDIFNNIRFSEFQEKLEAVSQNDSSLFLTLTPIFRRIRSFSLKKRIISSLKNRLGPFLLLAWRFFFSSLEKKYYSRKYAASFVNSLVKNYRFVILLGSVAPTKYDSYYKILKSLNQANIPVLVITRRRVMKIKFDELRSIENAKFILWDLEIKCLKPSFYLKINKASKIRAAKIIAGIEDEVIVQRLKQNQAYLELSIKKCLLLEEFYNKLFAKAKPQAVLANSFYGPILNALQGKDIKRIGLQHGLITGEGAKVEHNLDEFLIWGDFWKKVNPKWLFSDTKFISLGCPRFDDIVKWMAESRDNDFYKSLGLDPDKKTIVFFSSSEGPENPDGFYNGVIESLAELKRGTRANLIIKLHPGGETEDNYLHVFNRELLRNTAFIKGISIPVYKVLRHADLAIAVSSTALLEAMAFNIPVIQFNPDKNIGAMEFAQYGGGLLIREKSDLINKVARLLLASSYTERLVLSQKEFFNKAVVNLGKASNAIVNYLLLKNGAS